MSCRAMLRYIEVHPVDLPHSDGLPARRALLLCFYCCAQASVAEDVPACSTARFRGFILQQGCKGVLLQLQASAPYPQGPQDIAFIGSMHIAHCGSLPDSSGSSAGDTACRGSIIGTRRRLLVLGGGEADRHSTSSSSGKILVRSTTPAVCDACTPRLSVILMTLFYA